MPLRASIAARISPIAVPPRMKALPMLMLLLPKRRFSSSTPSRLEIVNTRSPNWNFVSSLGMMVLSSRDMAMTLNSLSTSGGMGFMNSESFMSRTGESSLSLNTAICSFPRANSMVSAVELCFRKSMISSAALFSG